MKLHLSCRTDLTRKGVLNMANRKRFRTKAQKIEAYKTAYKTKNGFYRSDATFAFR